jgi:hypothetical protein
MFRPRDECCDDRGVHELHLGQVDHDVAVTRRAGGGQCLGEVDCGVLVLFVAKRDDCASAFSPHHGRWPGLASDFVPRWGAGNNGHGVLL